MACLSSNRIDAPDQRHGDAGFTLTEMLVVLVIIALLVAIVAPNVLGRLGGARGQAARAQIENLASSLELYMLDTGRYPSNEAGLGALLEPPIDATGWSGPYLRRGRVPSDPWGRPFHYASAGPDQFTLTSYGRDGVAGGSGEDADVISSTVPTEVSAS